MIALKRNINGLISVIIFKRTMINISFNITNLQDNYLATYVSINISMTYTQTAAVLTYLCTLCVLLRASDWSSNVQRRKCHTLPFTRNCLVTSAPWVWSKPFYIVSCTLSNNSNQQHRGDKLFQKQIMLPKTIVVQYRYIFAWFKLEYIVAFIHYFPNLVINQIITCHHPLEELHL